MSQQYKEFMLAVKNGMTYHYGYIKIDEDHQDRDEDFLFTVVKSSFPTRDHVNLMISKYRQESERTLYTAKNSEELQEKFENRTDLVFGMIYETEWKLLKRLGVKKDGDV